MQKEGNQERKHKAAESRNVTIDKQNVKKNENAINFKKRGERELKTF